MDSTGVGKLKILVVDRDFATRGRFCAMLRKLGAATITDLAETEEALPYMRLARPEIVFCRWDESSNKVIAFTRKVRRAVDAPHQYAVIIAVGAATPAEMASARDAGVHDFMSNADSLAELARAIRNAVKHVRYFVSTKTYIGPDRRLAKDEPYEGVDRRKLLPLLVAPPYAKKFHQICGTEPAKIADAGVNDDGMTMEERRLALKKTVDAAKQAANPVTTPAPVPSASASADKGEEKAPAPPVVVPRPSPVVPAPTPKPAILTPEPQAAAPKPKPQSAAPPRPLNPFRGGEGGAVPAVPPPLRISDNDRAPGPRLASPAPPAPLSRAPPPPAGRAVPPPTVNYEQDAPEEIPPERRPAAPAPARPAAVAASVPEADAPIPPAAASVTKSRPSPPPPAAPARPAVVRPAPVAAEAPEPPTASAAPVAEAGSSPPPAAPRSTPSPTETAGAAISQQALLAILQGGGRARGQ
ncbi:MAG: hypothetical protein HQL37_07965 [Alphaproteobacteria bacterium]|nr:hypothetical protein [Alphaproteobacteria bacterium]